MTAEHAFDDADMPAHIARQPRMGRRMDVLGADPVAGREQAGCLASRSVGPPRCSMPATPSGVSVFATGFAGCSGFPASISSVRPGRAPASAVRARRARSGNSSCRDIPAAAGPRGQSATCRCSSRRASPSPASAQRRGVPIRRETSARSAPAAPDRTRHAAHVLRAVHQATSCGCFGRPVPIMLSRVTRSASRSSLQPSVPAGRIGSTR